MNKCTNEPRGFTDAHQIKQVSKRWGGETWLVNNEVENYCGKILHINAGHGTSMHYHFNKHETFYVLEGELLLEILDTRDGEKQYITLGKGEGFEVKRGQPHKLTSAVDTKVIEISTFHEDKDSHRLWM